MVVVDVRDQHGGLQDEGLDVGADRGGRGAVAAGEAGVGQDVLHAKAGDVGLPARNNIRMKCSFLQK